MFFQRGPRKEVFNSHLPDYTYKAVQTVIGCSRQPSSMSAKTPTTVVVLLLVGAFAFASPGPLPGTGNIPKLLADSALACKGEVISAPTLLRLPSSAGMARNTATAEVRPDLCFKGTPPGNSIPVRFDSYASSVNPGSFVLGTRNSIHNVEHNASVIRGLNQARRRPFTLRISFRLLLRHELRLELRR